MNVAGIDDFQALIQEVIPDLRRQRTAFSRTER
jgi:hypothetical protein